jgi:hypothetical protein
MGVQGVFTNAFYEGDVGTNKYIIRLQDETLGATLGSITNGGSTGPKTPGVPQASVSSSQRAIGVHPRYVTLKVTATGATAANASGSHIKLPILTKANYAAINEGDVGVYQGDTVQVIRKHAEHIV